MRRIITKICAALPLVVSGFLLVVCLLTLEAVVRADSQATADGEPSGWCLVLLTDHDHCLPCRKLSRNMQDDSVQEALQEQGILKLVFDRATTPSELFRHLRVRRVPTLLLVEVDDRGRMHERRRAEGLRTPSQLVSFCRP